MKMIYVKAIKQAMKIREGGGGIEQKVVSNHFSKKLSKVKSTFFLASELEEFFKVKLEDLKVSSRDMTVLQAFKKNMEGAIGPPPKNWTN